ncbi:hypothetical protein AB0M95_04075 [Sphaerisporangium sp. NPDC051017]|uniref:hypothetical protein n=1 Tax=Sphaerisporangium sp. NPDC051017 TaxID=3154636 RepID=UPI0034313A95
MAKYRLARTRFLAALALSAATVLTIAPPSNSATIDYPYSGLVEKTIVSGVVARNGTPVYGADVLVVAFPAGDVLDTLPINAEVPSLLVGAASSNSVGRFSVNVDPASLPSQYVDARGRVQLEITIADDTREVRWNTTAVPAQYPTPIGGQEERCGPDVTYGCELGEPVYVVPGAAGASPINIVVGTAGGVAVTPRWSTAKTEGLGASAPQQLVVDLGDQPKLYDVNDNPSTWMTAPAGEEVQPVPDGEQPPPATTQPGPAQPISAAAAAALRTSETAPRTQDFSFVDQAVQAGTITAAQMSAGLVPAAAKKVPCGWKTMERFPGREEQYMGFHNWLEAKGTLNQKSGADHTLGAAGKAPGSSKWTASGNATLSVSSAQEDVITRIVDAWAIGTVNYARWENTCSRAQLIKPTSLGDPIKKFVRANHPVLSGACIERYNGSQLTMTQSKNMTISAGVEVAGISLSSQSGYTNESKLTLDFKAGTKVCGSSSSGVNRSARIEAHKL